MSEQYVAAIDQGTTSHPVHDLRPRRPGRVASTRRSTSRSSRGPAGSSTTRSRSGTTPARSSAGALAKADLNAADIAAVGITNQRETALVWDRTTGEPVYNAIVWQDTRTDAICKQLGDLGGGAERYKDKVGLPLATYFSGPKVRWILDNVDGAREKAEAGDLLFGNMDTWVLWNMTGGVDGGVHVTDVTNASRTMLMDLDTLSLGRGHRRGDGHPAVDAARDPVVAREVYGEVRERGVAARRADRRHPRRPAGGHVRPGLPVGGRGQEHLRHRQLHAAQHRHARRCRARTACSPRSATRSATSATVYALEGSIAVTGSLVQWIRDNLGPDRLGAGDRDAGQDGRGQRRRVLRAGVLRPVRAVLARRRPRRDRRPDPLRQQGPHRPRGAGGHGLPDPRGARRDERRLGRRPDRAEGRRRHGRQRDPDAVPGRHPRRAGDPAGGRGDHRARRRLRRRAGRRVLGRARTTSARTGPRTSAGSRRWTTRTAEKLYRKWKKAVTKTFDWVDEDD